MITAGQQTTAQQVKLDSQETAELLCKALNQRLHLEVGRRKRFGSNEGVESSQDSEEGEIVNDFDFVEN